MRFSIATALLLGATQGVNLDSENQIEAEMNPECMDIE
jgi:hypothetical protein